MSDHHHHSAHGHGRRTFDPSVLIEREEARRSYLPQEETLVRFIERDDATLVDVGCGVGYFTLPAARMLSRGTVYATDVQADMVETTLKRAKEGGLPNVQGVVAPATDLPLEDESADLMLMSTMLHDVDLSPERRLDALREAARVLKPAGTLFVIEYDRIENTPGPPFAIRIGRDELVSMLDAAGLVAADVSVSELQGNIYFVKARRKNMTA